MLLRSLIGGLLAVASLSAAAAGEQTFTGVITDSMCANGDHSGMRMGDTAAECTTACVEAHGATYVLASGKDVFRLSDQRAPAKFAGQRVQVVGTLDPTSKTIAVEMITPASPSKR